MDRVIYLKGLLWVMCSAELYLVKLSQMSLCIENEMYLFIIYSRTQGLKA